MLTLYNIFRPGARTDCDMKDYQNLIGKLLIAGAIIVASLIVANALENLGQLINVAAMSLGNLIG